ncbi:MAG: hypothetical protein M1813_008159 [Trichoglossum hirsutum]|nr:MAG: hypothetical protein M1813_008159 [Trichoglossum hirsutum]
MPFFPPDLYQSFSNASFSLALGFDGVKVRRSGVAQLIVELQTAPSQGALSDVALSRTTNGEMPEELLRAVHSGDETEVRLLLENEAA